MPARKPEDNIERKGNKKMGIKLLNARDGTFSASYDHCEAVLTTFSSANASRMRHLKLLK